MAEADLAVAAEAFLKCPPGRSNLFDVHRHFHDVPSTAGEDSGDRADIAEVAAVGDGDVFPGGLEVVRRIKVHPAGTRRKNGEPRMTRICTDEPRRAFRRARAQVAADVARGQAERAQARDAEMREILADTAPLLPDFLERRRHGRGLR